MSFDKIFDLTAVVYFNLHKKFSDRAYYGLCVLIKIMWHNEQVIPHADCWVRGNLNSQNERLEGSWAQTQVPGI